MDPDLGEVRGGGGCHRGEACNSRVEDEEEAKQRAQHAAEEEVEAEFNRRLADKVRETCNSTELELVFLDGRRSNPLLIIRWARGRGVMAPHPSTTAKWHRFFDRYD